MSRLPGRREQRPNPFEVYYLLNLEEHLLLETLIKRLRVGGHLNAEHERDHNTDAQAKLTDFIKFQDSSFMIKNLGFNFEP